MWKLCLFVAAALFATSGCLAPGCIRNSECSYGLECRANKCQKPLPAATPVAGTAPEQCYAYWCPYVQDGGQLHYGGSGGNAASTTSTRYQAGGTSSSTGAGGMSSSATDAGTSTSGAGGSM